MKNLLKKNNIYNFLNCLIDKSLRSNIKKKFDDLVILLKKINISGDYKLDNILFDKSGNIILTDFTIHPKTICKIFPITYNEWYDIYKNNIHIYENFLERLKYYIRKNGKWNKVILK